jgi:4-amino-4-deoxy-L-arabinose transferase-like glycosyltransferase
MKVWSSDTLRATTVEARTLPVRSLLSERALRLMAVGAIVALAVVLRFANLAALGYVNHYYTAAVASMLQSWHNFFFAAAEPGASVTVDKPPLGLWVQAISAFVFGVNTWGVLLPELVAGVLSVVVLYHLVQRSFGTMAGLLAALALAITPVVVATDRNNTMDSLLILTLLLAAWAFIKATETGRLRFLLVGASLVGVGFNIKMLQAYLPLPAFLALYFLGARVGLARKVGHLALAVALLLVISLSWVTIVDLIPANERPYVGSSGDNSELSLVVGYNGLQRLTGMQGGGGMRRGNARSWQPGSLGASGPGQAWPGGYGSFVARRSGDYGGFPQGGPALSGGLPQAGPGGPGQSGAGAAGTRPLGNPGGGDGFGGRGGFMGTGRAGPLRLFTAPLSKEASWLLPFALFSALLVALATRLRWPVAAGHQAVVLWGGWLLTAGVFFSVAGFFHEYYLAMLAAPVAALFAIGVAELWRLHQRRWWLAVLLLVVAAAGTLTLQVATARAFLSSISWLPLLAGLLALGAVLLVVARRQWKTVALGGLACVVAAVLVTPGIWSWLTMLNSSENQSLPAAYDGAASGPANRGGLQVNQELLDYLQANTEGMKYLMAVPSAMQGADYVIATGRPVFYLGGFMGSDEVATSEDLAGLVANGELRYTYWGGDGGGPGGAQGDISEWLGSSCVAVEGFQTETRNSGAPDGTRAQSGRGGAGGFGDMAVELYDCAAQTR